MSPDRQGGGARDEPPSPEEGPSGPPRPRRARWLRPPRRRLGRRDGRRATGPPQVDPADRAQLAESPVAWPRVAALFAPHRWSVAAVMALIVASSVVAIATAVPAPRRHRRRPPAARRAAARCSPSAGWSRSPSSPRCSASCRRGARPSSGRRSCTGCAPTSSRHLQRQSLGFFTRTRGGEVQSRLTNDVAGMQGGRHVHRDVDRLEPHDRRRTAVAMVALSLAAVAALAAHPAAGHLALPAGRPAAPRHHVPTAAAPPGRHAHARSRRACRSAASGWPRPSAPASAMSSGSPATSASWSTSRCAQPARRPLADGDDADHLLGDPGAHLPGRRASRRRAAA